MADLVSYQEHDDVAVLTVNNPPVNALSPGVPEGIVTGVKAALANDRVGSIVLIGGGRTWIAGADIKLFVDPPEDGSNPTEPLHQMLDCVEESHKPVVCAIHGTALGAGLETAQACHFRIAVASARVGQPEVKLGLIPGAEATQRLPRLTGIPVAAELCVSGRMVAADEAVSLGILDEIVEGDLLEAAISYARAKAAAGEIRRTGDLPVPPLESAEERAAMQSLKDDLPPISLGGLAARRNVEAIEAAQRLSFGEGVAEEARLFMEVLHSDQSRGMIHTFFGERAVTKVPGISRETPRREFKQIVSLQDTPLTKALRESGCEVTVSGDVGGGNVDLVLAERIDQLNREDYGPDTVFAAPVVESDTDDPHTVGAVVVGRVLQISRGPHTLPAIVAALLDLAKRMNLLPIVFEQYADVSAGSREAFDTAVQVLVQEGLREEQIDGALLRFGLPTGPFGETTVHPEPAREDEHIVRAVMSRVADDARAMIDAGIAATATQIDMLWVRGYAFPAWRGGPVFYADRCLA